MSAFQLIASKHDTPASQMMVQHWTNIGPMYRVDLVEIAVIVIDILKLS